MSKKVLYSLFEPIARLQRLDYNMSEERCCIEKVKRKKETKKVLAVLQTIQHGYCKWL